MSSRYSERDYERSDREEPYGGRSGRSYDYERGYGGRGREGRGFMERTGEELRSWFSDEDAGRRRRMDERYGSEGYGGGESWRSDPGIYSGRSTAAYGGGMSAGENSILIRLSDTDFDLPEHEDIRGRKVMDQDGNEIGKVDDLLVDPRQRRVRFIQVTSGGFLGIGGTMLLVPVEAVTRFDREGVEIDRSGRAMGAMRYNPTLTDRRSQAGGGWGPSSGFTTGGRMTGGRYRGRGPRGYKRSDDRIREDVNDRLSDDPILDASGIEVVVSDGVVTLNGDVNDRADKRRAEDVALLVPGVNDVVVQLRVVPSDYGTSAATGTGTTTSPTATGAAAGGTSGSRSRSATT
jgi:sporulation protein YlmC with PRC-barrel domain